MPRMPANYAPLSEPACGKWHTRGSSVAKSSKSQAHGPGRRLGDPRVPGTIPRGPGASRDAASSGDTGDATGPRGLTTTSQTSGSPVQLTRPQGLGVRPLGITSSRWLAVPLGRQQQTNPSGTKATHTFRSSDPTRGAFGLIRTPRHNMLRPTPARPPASRVRDLQVSWPKPARPGASWVRAWPDIGSRPETPGSLGRWPTGPSGTGVCLRPQGLWAETREARGLIGSSLA